MMDLINATFNMAAALFILFNAVDIMRQKTVAGHTYPSAIFFTAWSLFSIFYFYGLNQPWTFWATVSMFIANAILLALVFKFRN